MAPIEELHDDRLSSADDCLWLAMRDADGLDAGRSIAERQWLVPGQQYLDAERGHINLLGTSRIIEPFSTDGTDWPKVVENFSLIHNVLNEAQHQGGYFGLD